MRAGRQARQAVGYLPEGDMVVVNDAAHLVGRPKVDVVVVLDAPDQPGTYSSSHTLPRTRARPRSGSALRSAAGESVIPTDGLERIAPSPETTLTQATTTAASSFVSESLASPKSIVVFGS